MSEEYRLFKFRPVNKYLLYSLVESQIYFSLPRSLNDPFDCQVNIGAAIDRAVHKSNGVARERLQLLRNTSEVARKIQSDIAKFGVCSFGLELKENAMWSHYADNHRGVALMYQVPPALIDDDRFGVLGISDIDYSDNALSNWLISAASSEDEWTPESVIKALLQKALTVKSATWRRECEVRIIKTEPGPHALPRGCLKQVCFGLRTPEPDRSLIRGLVAHHYDDVVFAEMTSDGTDFGLTAVELEP